jgi:hypothetical protein
MHLRATLQSTGVDRWRWFSICLLPGTMTPWMKSHCPPPMLAQSL